MVGQISLTPNQFSSLLALGKGSTELSTPEIAVGARLLPLEANAALAGLERNGLVHSFVPDFDRSGERMYLLTGAGQTLFHALGQNKTPPPVGSVVKLTRPWSGLSGWFSGQSASAYVEIIPDESGAL